MLNKEVRDRLKKELGFTVHRNKLHYLDRKGLVSPTRSDNGYGRYTEKSYKQVKLCCVLAKLGYGIDIIRQVLKGNEYIINSIINNLANKKYLIKILESELGK